VAEVKEAKNARLAVGKARERERARERQANPSEGVARVLAFFLPSETPPAEAATRASPIDFYF
jgi:hypothetical protein